MATGALIHASTSGLSAPGSPAMRRTSKKLRQSGRSLNAMSSGRSSYRIFRRQQIEQVQAAQARQLALFDMKADCRPAAERTAAGRYAEPTFFDSR
jgi:hypothetical protein